LELTTQNKVKIGFALKVSFGKQLNANDSAMSSGGFGTTHLSNYNE
jgi:hypothetical protein